MPATMTNLVTYSVTDAEIAQRQAKYASLSADTPQGYEEVRLAIADIREARVTIEKKRVELKADALAYGRLVDTEAKRLTVLLEAIEEPLKVKKAAIDDEKARVKAEADAAKVRALEAEIAANRARLDEEARVRREAEAAKLAEERARLDAERKQLAEERRQADEAAAVARKAEDERLRVERARLETIAKAQRAEGEALRAQLKRNREADEAAARAEREALESERRKVAAEREKAEREEFERQAKIKAEKEAVLKAERDRLEAAKRQARLDALKPDLEKMRLFAGQIRALVPPTPKAREAKESIARAKDQLEAIAADLEVAAMKAVA